MKKKIKMPQPICFCLNEGDEPVEMDISEPVWDWMQQVTDAINGEDEYKGERGELFKVAYDDRVSLEKVREMVRGMRRVDPTFGSHHVERMADYSYNQALNDVLEKLEEME